MKHYDWDGAPRDQFAKRDPWFVSAFHWLRVMLLIAGLGGGIGACLFIIWVAVEHLLGVL